MGTPDALGERLRGMLLAPTAAKGNNGASQQPSSSRPLIEEVVPGGGDRPATTMTDDEDEDDDGPPPISFRGDPAPPPRPSTGAASGAPPRAGADGPAKPTLAEQLLAEADAARQKEKKERTERERTKANKSTFGMKKGFLNASSGKRGDARKKKTGGGGKQAQKAAKSTSTNNDGGNALARKGDESNLVYELDGEGNMVPSSATSTPDDDGTRGSSSSDPLHLPEVQSAMLEHLQSQSSQWATPDLLDSISQNHPKLARGMADPRYMAALQSMQSRPKETLERLKGESPEIVEWLMEFCGVMGEHFTKLGEAQDGRKGGTKESGATMAEGAKVREVGPLEEKALRAHQSQNEQPNNPHPKEASANPTEEAQLEGRVASILADDELRSILLDPAMQRIMEECAHPGKVRYYLGHPEHGPKLRRLMDAGLIRLG